MIHRESKRILFRCDSGSNFGFGHFMRCLNLARTLLEIAPSSQTLFWGEYDEFARDMMRHYRIDRLSMTVTGYTLADAVRAHEACSSFDVLVLDSYQMEQPYLDALKGRPCRLAVLDDAHQLNLVGADLAICFRAGAERLHYGTSREALGTDYLVVKPELRQIRRKNLLSPPDSISNILLFLTGATVDEQFLASVVGAVSLPGMRVTYLCQDGRPVEGTSGATARKVGPSIEHLYSDADLIVCGGGLVKYESAYCGILNACLSQTPLQEADSKIMAERNLTLDLGSNACFEPHRVREALTQFVANSVVVSAHRNAFQRMLDTDSPRRLAEVILSL